MNYLSYLQSAHWKKFKEKIYSERKYCQNCCTTENLNLHHKSYVNIGKETGDDVIVLCKNCHFRFHAKPKWIKAKYNCESMDFTKASHLERPLFAPTSEMRKCRRCGEMHGLFYKTSVNKTLLGMACPNSKPRIQYISYEHGLDIPFLPDKRKA